MSRHRSHLAVLAAIGIAFATPAAHATDQQVARGEYLVNAIGCADCHTAGSFFGHPDIQHNLAGSDVGFAIPNLGVFVGSNLTPDKATGLGDWTARQIVTAFTTGVRPDGRILAPAMPWRNFAHLTPADAMAIAMYLKSLPPVKRATPGPFGADQTPTVFVMPILSPENYMRLTHPHGAPAK